MLAATNVYSVPESAAYGQIATTPIEVTVETATVENTEALVRSYFKDVPVLIQIARCESAFRQTLPDGSILQGRVDSADTGVMQINKRYHANKAATMGLNLDDLYNNMAYARYLYETQGTKPWNASASCWSKTLAMNI